MFINKIVALQLCIFVIVSPEQMSKFSTASVIVCQVQNYWCPAEYCIAITAKQQCMYNVAWNQI